MAGSLQSSSLEEKSLIGDLSFDFWFDLFADLHLTKIEAITLYQVNSFFQEIVLLLIQRNQVYDTELIGYGTNQFGQMAKPSFTDYEENVQYPEFINKITKVLTGGDGTIFITSDYKILTAGSNFYDQLGRGVRYNSITTLREVIEDANGNPLKKIVDGYANPNRTFLISDDGSIYGIGDNSNGELGLDFNEIVTNPTLIKFDNNGNPLKKIVQVSSFGIYEESGSTMMVAEDGSVYSTGFNIEGILGLGIPRETVVTRPTLIQMDIHNNPLKKIKEVSVGIAHGYLLAEDGSVYSVGNNSNGVLGLNLPIDEDRFFINRPQMITEDINGTKLEKIKKVFAYSNDKSFFIGESCHLYKIQNRPTLVDFSIYEVELDIDPDTIKFMDLSTFSHDTLIFLDENGNAYALFFNIEHFTNLFKGTNVLELSKGFGDTHFMLLRRNDL